MSKNEQWKAIGEGLTGIFQILPSIKEMIDTAKEQPIIAVFGIGATIGLIFKILGWFKNKFLS